MGLVQFSIESTFTSSVWCRILGEKECGLFAAQNKGSLVCKQEFPPPAITIQDSLQDAMVLRRESFLGALGGCFISSKYEYISRKGWDVGGNNWGMRTLGYNSVVFEQYVPGVPGSKELYGFGSSDRPALLSSL